MLRRQPQLPTPSWEEDDDDDEDEEDGEDEEVEEDDAGQEGEEEDEEQEDEEGEEEGAEGDAGRNAGPNEGAGQQQEQQRALEAAQQVPAQQGRHEAVSQEQAAPSKGVSSRRSLLKRSDALIDTVASLVIGGELLLADVAASSFRRVILKSLDPDTSQPSRTDVICAIQREFRSSRERLREVLDSERGGLSLSAMVWHVPCDLCDRLHSSTSVMHSSRGSSGNSSSATITSTTTSSSSSSIHKVLASRAMTSCGCLKESFLHVTAHWIDNAWERRALTLDFLLLPTGGSAEGRRLVMAKCVEDWKLTRKIIAVVTDGATESLEFADLCMSWGRGSSGGGGSDGGGCSNPGVADGGGGRIAAKGGRPRLGLSPSAAGPSTSAACSGGLPDACKGGAAAVAVDDDNFGRRRQGKEVAHGGAAAGAGAGVRVEDGVGEGGREGPESKRRKGEDGERWGDAGQEEKGEDKGEVWGDAVPGGHALCYISTAVAAVEEITNWGHLVRFLHRVHNVAKLLKEERQQRKICQAVEATGEVPKIREICPQRIHEAMFKRWDVLYGLLLDLLPLKNAVEAWMAGLAPSLRVAAAPSEFDWAVAEGTFLTLRPFFAFARAVGACVCNADVARMFPGKEHGSFPELHVTVFEFGKLMERLRRLRSVFSEAEEKESSQSSGSRAKLHGVAILSYGPAGAMSAAATSACDDDPHMDRLVASLSPSLVDADFSVGADVAAILLAPLEAATWRLEQRWRQHGPAAMLALALNPLFRLDGFEHGAFIEWMGQEKAQLLLSSCAKRYEGRAREKRDLVGDNSAALADVDVGLEAALDDSALWHITKPPEGAEEEVAEYLAKYWPLPEENEGNGETESGHAVGKKDKGKYDVDILAFWKANEAYLPSLAAAAREVLAIPAGAVRSWSAGCYGARRLDEIRKVRDSPGGVVDLRVVRMSECVRDWRRQPEMKGSRDVRMSGCGTSKRPHDLDVREEEEDEDDDDSSEDDSE